MKKSRSFPSFLPSRLVWAGVALSAAAPLSAAVLTWDTAGGDSTVTGGTGNWNTVNTNWTADAGVTNISWPATGTDNDASFGAPAGTVTIDDAGITANDITFATTGYTLSGGPLTLNGAANILTAGTGVAVTIGSDITATAGGANFVGGGSFGFSRNYAGAGKEFLVKGSGTTLNYSGDSFATGKFIVGSNNGAGNPVIFNLTAGFVTATGNYVGIGDGGDANATLTGGTLTAGAGSPGVFIGNGAGITATVTIDGGGLSIVSGNLNIGSGYNGSRTDLNTSGTLTLNEGFLDFSSTGGINISNGGTQTGTVNLNGGIFYLNGKGLNKGAGGTAKVNIGGGLISLTANNPNIFGTGVNPVINAGGFTLDTGFYNAVISTNLTAGTGNGGLVKQGFGILTLAGVNTYTGGTQFNDGGLDLGRPDTIAAWNTPGSFQIHPGMSYGARLGGATGFSDTQFATLRGNASFEAGSSLIIDTANASYTYAADLAAATNAGADIGLVKLGGNTLTLGGSQTFNGNLVINGGPLVIDVSGPTTLPGAITGNQALTIQGAGNTTLSGFGSSVGLLTKNGTGSLSIPDGSLFTNGNNILFNQGNVTQSGGTVTGGLFTVVGHTAGQTASYTISDGSLVSNTRNMVIGENGGTGVLTLTGGTLSATYNVAGIILAHSATSTGTFNLDGGTATISSITADPGGAATLNLNGSQLIASQDSATFIGANLVANVRNGGAKIDTGGHALTLVAGLQHSAISADAAKDGGLVKSGLGSLALSATGNTYTGDTTVSEGTLTLNQPFLADASHVTVAPGAFLDLETGATDTVASLTIDGAAAADGIWGPVGSGAAHTSASLIGTGLLSVGAGGSTPFQIYVSGYGLTGNDALAGADPDRDGASNLLEFALHGNPTSGSDNGTSEVLVQDASAPAGKELTLVIAARNNATFAAGPASSQTATQDGVTYRVEGSVNLASFNSAVSFVSVSDTAAGQPSLAGTDWRYYTFKLDASEGLGGKGFLRAVVTGTP